VPVIQEPGGHSSGPIGKPSDRDMSDMPKVTEVPVGRDQADATNATVMPDSGDATVALDTPVEFRAPAIADGSDGADAPSGAWVDTLSAVAMLDVANAVVEPGTTEIPDGGGTDTDAPVAATMPEIANAAVEPVLTVEPSATEMLDGSENPEQPDFGGSLTDDMSISTDTATATTVNDLGGPAATMTADRPMLAPVQATLSWLRDARRELDALDPDGSRIASTIRALRNIEVRVTKPIKIAILGEFNSGKSTLANMLLGIDGLPTAMVSNTCIPTSLAFAHTPAIIARYRDGRQERLTGGEDVSSRDLAWLDVRLPCERLRDYQIIDLPGVGDPSRAMPTLDRARIQPDAVIWCTVSTQAWRESERFVWTRMPRRLHRHTVLVSTFADLLADDEERAKVTSRLMDGAGPLFGEIVMLATLDAIAARQLPDEAERQAALAASGAMALEGALERLAAQVMQHRSSGAHALAGRVAGRTLEKLGA